MQLQVVEGVLREKEFTLVCKPTHNVNVLSHHSLTLYLQSSVKSCGCWVSEYPREDWVSSWCDMDCIWHVTNSYTPHAWSWDIIQGQSMITGCESGPVQPVQETGEANLSCYSAMHACNVT